MERNVHGSITQKYKTDKWKELLRPYFSIVFID